MLEGKWFWTEGWHKEDDEKAKLVLFRAAFEGKPDNTRIRITADTRYKLYVNDIHVQSGPSKGDDKVRYIDEADIGEWLTDGKNVIAVNVLRYSFDHPYHSNHSLFASQVPGLYVEGIDLKWKSHVVRTVRFEGEEGGFAPLHVHERIATDPAARGWKKASFDDSAWDDTVEYSDEELPDILKPENLADRTIPYMRRSKVCFRSATDNAWEALIRGNGQVTIPENSDLSVTLDAGEEMTAFPNMKMHAGAGTNLEILYSECYTIPAEHGTIKGNRLDRENGILEGYTDTYYITEDGDWEYEPYWMRTFRFVRIRIRTGSKPLVIRSLTMEETGYPLEVKSEVRTSDKTLEGIWDISLRTLRRCMHETYMDCPFYEQLSYVMDTRSQILYTYAVSADDRLARKAIDDFRRSQREDGLLNASYPNRNENVIPGFSIYYILMVHDHMMYFGDKALVRQCMPSIKKALAFFDEHREGNGLVSKIGGLNRIDRFWSFIDWADDWLPTTGMPRCGLSGPNSLESLLYTMGLKAAAELAEYIGESELAEKYRHNAAAMRDAVRCNCMDKDGLLTDGPDTADLSQHAQVLGVLTGTFSPEEGRKAMQKCMTENGFTRCTVAWNFYLFRALEETSLYHLTNGCWDVWRHMIANGCTTCVESEGYNRSECHAWGSLILYELPSVTLGVRPASPGYETAIVAPVPGYLDHAEGTVHTPRGDVRVAWHRNKSGIECHVDADKGIHFSSNSVLR
ncbi:MAG: hypothetical protein IKF42_08840 [Mogibacterium sp.]|nr:hypothetical protein [Mogibacterium sp.]